MKYFIILAGICLAACNSTLPPAAQDSTITAKDTAIATLAGKEENEVPRTDTFTTMFFDDLSITLAPINVPEYEDPDYEGDPDTIRFSLNPGDALEGVKIYISSDKLTDLKVEEQLETYMMIATEEGIYELGNWKHGHTAWEELLKDNDTTFVGRFFSAEDYKIFPEVTLEEVKAAVKEQGGEQWLKLIKDVKTVKDDPLEVSGDTYYLRISGKRKSDGTIVTKILVITETSGC